ncbi:MAG: trimethylamine methyltransferase family protein [Rhodospirillales bacterium]
MGEQAIKSVRRGRSARRTERAEASAVTQPYISRQIPLTELCSEEGLELLERNADIILQETGIEFRDDAEVLNIWREAGAQVDGERVRFPKGLQRTLLKTAPAEFTQHARNPDRNVVMGGKNLVFAPVYGPPFVRDLDGGRRYGTIADF